MRGREGLPEKVTSMHKEKAYMPRRRRLDRKWWELGSEVSNSNLHELGISSNLSPTSKGIWGIFSRHTV
jgi:hypothetical protein